LISGSMNIVELLRKHLYSKELDGINKNIVEYIENHGGSKLDCACELSCWGIYHEKPIGLVIGVVHAHVTDHVSAYILKIPLVESWVSHVTSHVEPYMA